MNDPFEKFYRVPTAQELMDYAYHKAGSKTASTPKTLPHLDKVKRKEKKRLDNVIKYLTEKIRRIINSVPNLDELPEFFGNLSHLLVNNDELKLALGRLNGIIPVLVRLERDFRRKIGMSVNPKACSAARVSFFGRCSSILKKQASILIFLDECRVKLQAVPPLNLSMPSVVFAGYPNVGKSSIVGQMSTAKPQVSEYPFTTKQIFLGMYKDKLGSRYFQVIDTPGILDRPMVRRNDIEKQAILALNTVATVILFIFDPTVASGYDVDSQIQLYEEIQTVFLKDTNIPTKIIINKIDFAQPEEIDTLLEKLKLTRKDVILTNAVSGEGVDSIIKYLLKYFKETDYLR